MTTVYCKNKECVWQEDDECHRGGIVLDENAFCESMDDGSLRADYLKNSTTDTNDK